MVVFVASDWAGGAAALASAFGFSVVEAAAGACVGAASSFTALAGAPALPVVVCVVPTWAGGAAALAVVVCTTAGVVVVVVLVVPL